MLHIQVSETTFAADRVAILRGFIQLCRDRIHGSGSTDGNGAGAPSMEDATTIALLSPSDLSVLEQSPALPFRLGGLSRALERYQDGGVNAVAGRSGLSVGQAGILVMTALFTLQAMSRVDPDGARIMFGVSHQESRTIADVAPMAHSFLAPLITLSLTPAMRSNAAILRLRHSVADRSGAEALLAFPSVLLATLTVVGA